MFPIASWGLTLPLAVVAKIESITLKVCGERMCNHKHTSGIRMESFRFVSVVSFKKIG